MSYTILEQIAQALKTRLETVTAANGYTVTLSSVKRPTKFGNWTPEHLVCLLTQEDPQPEESTFDADHRACVFLAHVGVSDSDDSDEPIDTLLNGLAGDLEKAIFAERKLGGLAENIEILGPQKWQEKGFVGITLRFRVSYRHAKGDPFTAAE